MLVAGLDLVRAYVGTGLRPWQWAAGLAFVLALWSWLGERGLEPRARAPWVGLAALLVPTYVDHARRLERGDSIHYYSYLRSLLFDGDLALGNDYALLGWPEVAVLPNVLPVGAPILWSPFVVVVHVVRQLGRLFGLGAPDGTEPVYQATVAFATLLYGTAALFLLMHALRRWVPAGAAFWATVIVWVGSPLRFYLSVLPGMAHGVELFAGVLVLRAFLWLRDVPAGESLRSASVAVGAACGLVFLTRSQDGILLLLPALELLRRLRATGRRPVLLAGVTCIVAFAAVALPQMAVWQAQFGRPLLVPHKAIHGDQFLHASQPELLGILWSDRGGLFSTHPALLLAVVGLVLLALSRRDRAYALAVAPVLLAAWWLNASIFDWYHVRRFTGIVPLLAPGLAVALAPLVRPVAGVAAVAILAFAVLRYDVAVDSLRSVPGDPAPPRAVVSEMGVGLIADAYAVAERVAPSMAVSALDRATGVGLVGAAGAGVLDVDLGGEPLILRLPRRARNLGQPVVVDGVRCRWMREEDVRLFVPVLVSGDGLSVVITAFPRPGEGGTWLELLWNEQPAGTQEMVGGWSPYSFNVPGAVVRPGTNVLAIRALRQRPEGAPAADTRRPAALARVYLTPSGGGVRDSGVAPND